MARVAKFTNHQEMCKRTIHILFVMLVLGTNVFSQEYYDFDDDKIEYDYRTEQEKYLDKKIEKKRFDKEKWEKLREEIIEEHYDEPVGDDFVIRDNDNPYEGNNKKYRDYFRNIKKNKNTDKVKVKTEELKPRRHDDTPRINPADIPLIPGWLGWVIIGILFAFLIGLIFYLFFNAPSNEENKKVNQAFEEIAPSEIPKSELERRLEEALANNDYRLATRIYFIFIIKELSDKSLIHWEKEKTNYSYLLEMRNHQHYNAFSEAIMLYELIWYGKRKVSVDDYKSIEPVFKTFLTKIEKAK